MGTNFSYRKSLTKTYTLSANAGVSWRIGLLRLNAGLSIAHALSKLPGGDLTRDNKFVYLRATRDLFW